MKITICGSIAFIDEMSKLQTELSKLGHDVKIPDKSEHNEYGDDISSAEFYKLKKTGF